MSTGINSSVNWFRPLRLGEFFGVACFSIEGIGLIFPIRSTMSNYQSFRPVFHITASIVVFWYFIFGATGALVGSYSHAVPGKQSKRSDSVHLWTNSARTVLSLRTVRLGHLFILPDAVVPDRSICTEQSSRSEDIRHRCCRELHFRSCFPSYPDNILLHLLNHRDQHHRLREPHRSRFQLCDSLRLPNNLLHQLLREERRAE